METVVPSDAVAPKTFFLEALNTPLIINSIRVVAVLLVAFFIIYYLRHRPK